MVMSLIKYTLVRIKHSAVDSLKQSLSILFCVIDTEDLHETFSK